MQSPGAPVMRPETSAAKPAEPSWAVSTNSTPPLRIASISGSTLPLGMPKPRAIPFALSVATIRSALFMGWGIDRPGAVTLAANEELATRRHGRRQQDHAPRAGLVVRFRSSYHFAARTFTNFG